MIGEGSNLEGCFQFVTGWGDAWTRGNQGGSTLGIKNVLVAINLSGSATVLGNSYPFCSYHTGGAHFASGDGAAFYVSEDIDMTVYLGLASRSGGELYSIP
jgi:hypothetical protein